MLFSREVHVYLPESPIETICRCRIDADHAALTFHDQAIHLRRYSDWSIVCPCDVEVNRLFSLGYHSIFPSFHLSASGRLPFFGFCANQSINLPYFTFFPYTYSLPSLLLLHSSLFFLCSLPLTKSIANTPKPTFKNKPRLKPYILHHELHNRNRGAGPKDAAQVPHTSFVCVAPFNPRLMHSHCSYNWHLDSPLRRLPRLPV